MYLTTKHFGEIEYDEQTIINFADGLPGFSEATQFVLINEVDDVDDGLFYWLQCVDDSELAFALIDVYQVIPDYNPMVDRNEIASLGDYNPDNFLIYNVVVLPENIKNMSVNLLAPVVINPDTRKGKQVIAQNDSYGVRHLVFE